MPAGIIVDGELILEAGVFVENLYANFNSGPNGQGIVAVVGDFPFLAPGTVYLSTTRSAFEYLIAPGEPVIKRLSNVIYESSRVVRGAPGAVILISAQASTQAEVDLLSDQGDIAAVIGTFTSNVYGTRGNSTQIVIEENADLGGYAIEITTYGVTEPAVVQTSDESNVLTFDYARTDDLGAWSGATAYAVGNQVSSAGVWYICILAHTNQVPPNGTYWTVVTTSRGFETLGGGSGTVSAEKVDAPNKLNVTFSRTIPFSNCLTSTNNSWVPEAPVVGALTVTVKAGVTINAAAATITARITGVTAAGAVVENLVFTPNVDPDFTVDDDQLSANTWLSVTNVKVFADTDVSGHIIDGNFQFDGTVAQLNVTDGTTTAADAITALTAVTGFTASTGSNLVSEALLSKLDNKVLETLPITLSAKVWSIERAVNAQSDFVAFEAARYNVPDMTPTPVTLDLVGGTNGVSTTSSLQAAFDELLFHDVSAVVWMGTSDTGNDIVADHVDKAWGKYQNERTGFIGVLANSTYATLATLAGRINTQRIQRFHQKPKIKQYLGAVETQGTEWMALMAASAANINRRRSLDKWQPRIEGVEQNSNLNLVGMSDALMLLGYNVVSRKNSSLPYKLLRELSTWLTDNNPYRTAPAAVRSSADMQRYVRLYAENIIENTDSPALLKGLLKTGISAAMDTLETEGTIEIWNRASLNVVDAGQAFEIDVEYTPSGSKSQVKIKATVAAPVAV